MIQWVKNLGHWFIALGAVICYRFPARKLKVIGVTGTDGKTTTATLIYHILKTAGMRVVLISTVAAYIGEEEIDTGFHVTSPEPWALQRLLRRIVDEGYKYLVLEATSHGLDQHRLWGTNIKIGVLTNITHEHLDYHKTYQNYVRAKAKLFKNADLAVVNADDESYERVIKLIPQATTVIGYTRKKSVSRVIKERFPEPYNQSNAVAAEVVARRLEVDQKVIDQAIKSFKSVKGRLEEIKNSQGIKVVVDFAHTPNALENALKGLKKSTKGRLIAIYGAAGERDVTKRPLMGDIGARLADEVVLTAEDPRTEKVNTIIHQMKDGITTNHGHVHEMADRQKAVNFAIVALAEKGDTIGIFGKGHEKSMNLDGKSETPWSDQKAAEKALNLRSRKTFNK